MDEKVSIYELAALFRRMIETCEPKPLTTLERFPLGSCGDASLLLAEFLSSRGAGQFDYVLGHLGERSHAWLQRDALVVDITADQFGEGLASIIVQDNSLWHAGLAGESQHEARIDIYDDFTKATLHRAYRAIIDRSLVGC